VWIASLQHVVGNLALVSVIGTLLVVQYIVRNGMSRRKKSYHQAIVEMSPSVAEM
jgi:hypothetical protein